MTEQSIVQNKPIIYETRNETAWIYLNRPNDFNAIGRDILLGLVDAIEKVEQDPAIKVVVLSGKGKAFCAGANLKELLDDINHPQPGEKGLLDFCELLFPKLEKLSKPLIVALNGVTAAGGLELAMCADFVIASEKAKIGDAHANFGVLPGGGGAVKLPRKIGVSRAKYLLFTGEFISAEEMKDYGLVQEVVEAEELEARVQEIADKLSEKSPLVLRKMKELVADGLEQPLDIALKQELLALKVHTRSYDLSEGLAAFTEKRKPNFKGY